MRDSEILDVPLYMIEVLWIHELVREQSYKEIQGLMLEIFHQRYSLKKIERACRTLKRLSLLRTSVQYVDAYIITTCGKEVIERMRTLLHTHNEHVLTHIEKSKREHLQKHT